MREHEVSHCCAWCGARQAGDYCPGCGHELGRARQDCACPACRQDRRPVLVPIADTQYRDPTLAIACRIRVYAPAATEIADRLPPRSPVILCTRLDRADERDGAIALGPDGVLMIAAIHIAPIGRADAPAVERFLWLEGRGREYALLSFAPNRDESGGRVGWREAFGTVLRRIPLSLGEVIALTGDRSLAAQG